MKRLHILRHAKSSWDEPDLADHERPLAPRGEKAALRIAEHAPITMRVTKEAVRRLQAARRTVDGDDLIALTYTSADFREGVRAFLDKRKPRWTGT